MITYKTEEEIEIMAEGGKKLKAAMKRLLPLVKAGVTTEYVDKMAEKFIREEGAEPSFTRVDGYKWTICATINEQVVHTPPSKRKLAEGDLFTIDIGAYYKGFHTDHSTSFVIGEKPTPEVKRFLEVGEDALQKAIAQAVVGNRIGHISKAIEETVEGAGYYIMEQLTGHGVGHELHEDPFIPGFLSRPIEKTMKLRQGMVLAIEVIYSMGTRDIAYEKGGDWSIVTADGSLSACFEHTVAVYEKNTVVLT